MDIDSIGHGIETVTVTRVGTQAIRTNLTADASAGGTSIKVRSVNGFGVGDKLRVGTPANHETVTITAIAPSGPTGAALDFSPALARPHTNREVVVTPGTGLDLAAPLRFNHAANLPFSAKETGISLHAGDGRLSRPPDRDGRRIHRSEVMTGFACEIFNDTELGTGILMIHENGAISRAPSPQCTTRGRFLVLRVAQMSDFGAKVNLAGHIWHFLRI